jgi:hypothetical protein
MDITARRLPACLVIRCGYECRRYECGPGTGTRADLAWVRERTLAWFESILRDYLKTGIRVQRD